MKIIKKQNQDNFLNNIKNIWQTAKYLKKAKLEFTLISKLKYEFINKKVTNKKKLLLF